MDKAGAGAARKKPFWRRRRWWTWCGVVVLGVLVALAIAVSVALHHAEPFLRARIVSALEGRFHAHVELDSFHMSLINGLQAEGKGLRIWPPGPPGSAGAAKPASGAPLIRLAEFRFRAPLYYVPGKPFHIARVELNGLDVVVPPKGQRAQAAGGAAHSHSGPHLLKFNVVELVCTNSRLTMETNKPGKLPLEFPITRLELTNLTAEGAMNFNAKLTNPRPVGTIYAKGKFGPWVVDDPGHSAVTGTYHFEHANLATFTGIAGILNSTGRYSGTLRNLNVDGETETPGFRLSMGGNALDLRTEFHARVDGTDGDTWLEPVDATLGGSHFTAQGKIVRVPAPGEQASGGQNGQHTRSLGRDIALTVNVDRGRIGDFLLLTTNDPKPLLTGSLTMKTTLDIPPGPAPVTDKLKLKGSFALSNVLFASPKIQDRIEELSLHGQGKPKAAKSADAPAVLSAIHGDFQMANGTVTLPNLVYTVPGAEIILNGTYGVNGGALNFSGKARMQATVSKMVGGWKGVLLTPVDKFFEHNGAGTVIPIEVKGTRKDPHFGIDFGRAKKTSPQRSGGP
ncbi:MAG: hypothetical protein ACRD3N_01975 [Terracidiphilus sp.]